MPERLLLCTDLDRTLIPNGPQPESAGAREHLATLAADPRVVLAYVSGRHRQLVEKALRDYRLPLPDFVIGDVGTTIYRVMPDGYWQLEERWERQIAGDWNDRTNADLQQLLADIEGLRLQEASRQNTHKLSYYVAVASDRGSLTRTVMARLQADAVRARLVWSVDETTASGLLDILPEQASKYHAVAMLQSMQGFSNDDTVFCGDSGNDIEVLASPVPAVLVANSAPDVRAEALRKANCAGTGQALYIASGGFHGMNGNYSSGILEGIAHYHPSTLGWMGLGEQQ